MPSPGEDYQSWSTVASDNGNADPLINWVEGQTRASVNNSSRSELASHAKNRNLLNGSIVTTGTANAQAFLSGVTYTTVPTGLIVKLKIGAGLTNTASATLNMDGIGAVLIQTASGSNLLGGELVANSYTDFVYNGTYWIFLYSREFFFDLVTGGPGMILGVQKFASPGAFTYTPTAGMECCTIECIGGGGGGGQGHNDGPPAFLCQGGGGGAGGYSRKQATAADIGASKTVTVGAGGLGNGAAGGASSVGALCVANGGQGGPNNNYNNFGGGGAGGAAGVGDIAAAGAPGDGGTYLLFTPGTQQFDCSTGAGGSSIFGGGATPVLVGYSGGPATGNAASNYGSGGSGGASGLYGSPGNGGAGSAGIVIITEFAARGSPGRDGAAGAVGPIGPTGPAGPGTGDVLRSGTPTAGQYAVWVDASHIQGAAAASDFSTGDVKLTLKIVADAGWLLMNDQTIGKATSAATYANDLCLALYTLLWTNISNTYAPVSSGRGANAAADWAANKTLKLPLTLGRALARAGSGLGLTARQPGETGGAETVAVPLPQHNHTISDPSHTHAFGGNNLNIQASYTTVDPGSAYNVSLWGGYLGVTSGAVTGISIANAGTPSATMSVVQPTAYLNVMIKL